ncbi:protein phosphatase [Bhargavaea cecembensis]|uniref:Protein phosphatase n=1 Tax=Bhargavaea cecembensis TaxID=394098 RepID=A0A165GQ04_9BACL|nr:protein phosphatase 2C domain-containing protein [Bhargavaea cecembensis]KZE37235.1 protein phosphatase [Bhargavaea cecembensis]
MTSFNWVGSQDDFVGQPDVLQLNHIVVGRYGGNSTAGQSKNEDGCLVWFSREEGWELAVVLDAHYSAESAGAVLELFGQEEVAIRRLLALPEVYDAFRGLEEKILDMFMSDEFLATCRKVKGETACLIAARKGRFVWWLSVGDCLLYLFHPELARMGQYQINQRQFYEWIGQVNTFAQEAPCYTIGTRELRKGENRLFLTTDGLVECPGAPFFDPVRIDQAFDGGVPAADAVHSILETIRQNGVRDSTTIITWDIKVTRDAAQPSDLHKR